MLYAIFYTSAAWRSQRPEKKRQRKNAARNTQSSSMATHTPMAPQPSMEPKIQLNRMRKTHMENTDTTMVNRTSPAARSAPGSTKATGHSSMAKPSWMNTSQVDSCNVSAETLYIFSVQGKVSRITVFRAIMAR